MSDLIERREVIAEILASVDLNDSLDFNRGLDKAIQIIKDTSTTNCWIPCSEQIMPDDERVLMCLTNGEVFVMTRSGDVVSDGLRHLTDLSGVERWMQIPDAYEQSEVSGDAGTD